MSEKIIVEFDSVEELNLMAGALGNLPYSQVFQLLDKIGKQAGPQLRATEEAKAETTEEVAE